MPLHPTPPAVAVAHRAATRALVLAALARADGHRPSAANALGATVRTVQRWIEADPELGAAVARGDAAGWRAGDVDCHLDPDGVTIIVTYGKRAKSRENAPHGQSNGAVDAANG